MKGRRVGVLSVLSLAFAFVLGSYLVARRLEPRAAAPHGRLQSWPAFPTAAAAGPSLSAALALAPAAPPAVSTEAKGKESEKKPIDSAVVGTTGGVPVHTEGPYRSPFANPGFGAPAIVKVGFLFSHIADYDIKEGTFKAEFYLSYTSDRTMPPMDPDFTNGKVDEKEVVADTPTFKLYHFRGEFESLPDLRNYPFDRQELEIEIEDNQNGGDQIKLVADLDYTHLDAGFQMPGWLVEDYTARVLDRRYPPRFANDDLYYGRYHFILGVRRFATSAVFSVFVPAFVIVFISLLGLWFPREELEVRSNASAPMLAAAVIFHFTLNQSLPATPYLTRADKLMMGVYISLILNMLATWAWFVFGEKHVERIFRLGKYVIPPVTVVVMALACGL
jgi:hypothetical protein